MMSDLAVLDGAELFALAQYDLEQHRLDQALIKIKYMLNSDAHPEHGFAVAARVYAQLKLFEQAIALFERFLTLQPEALNEQFQLGMVHFDTGQPSKALTIWDKLLSAHPHYPPALFYSALVHAQSNQPEQADRRLEMLLQHIPVDNLYYEKAKQLMAHLERTRSQSKSNQEDEQQAADSGYKWLKTDPPYGTEH